MAIFSTIKPLFPPFPWAGSGFAPCAVGWDGVRLHWSVSGNVGFGGWPRGPGGLADDQREWQQSAMQLSLGYGMSVCQSAAWQEASDEQGERDYCAGRANSQFLGFGFLWRQCLQALLSSCILSRRRPRLHMPFSPLLPRPLPPPYAHTRARLSSACRGTPAGWGKMGGAISFLYECRGHGRKGEPWGSREKGNGKGKNRAADARGIVPQGMIRTGRIDGGRKIKAGIGPEGKKLGLERRVL